MGVAPLWLRLQLVILTTSLTRAASTLRHRPAISEGAGAASEAESEDGNDGGKNRDHAPDGTAMSRKSLASLGLSEF